jgi:hypothetical protein
MAARLDWNDNNLIMESVNAYREGVSCIDWLDDRCECTRDIMPYFAVASQYPNQSQPTISMIRWSSQYRLSKRVLAVKTNNPTKSHAIQRIHIADIGQTAYRNAEWELRTVI